MPPVGWSAGDFERWLKGALEVECLSLSLSLSLSLRELCEWKVEGGLPCWEPWRIGRKGSGGGHIFP